MNFFWKTKSIHNIPTYVVCCTCRNLRAFRGDQTDPKSTCGGPNSILRTGCQGDIDFGRDKRLNLDDETATSCKATKRPRERSLASPHCCLKGWCPAVYVSTQCTARGDKVYLLGFVSSFMHRASYSIVKWIRRPVENSWKPKRLVLKSVGSYCLASGVRLWLGHMWRCEYSVKKFGQAPPPHVDKIQKNSSFFSWPLPCLALVGR